jgi:ABC-type branched-subunit amino acid transport system substrate-binding protein
MSKVMSGPRRPLGARGLIGGRGPRGGRAAVALLAALTLALTACGGGDDGDDGGGGAGNTTGITDDRVLIGGHYPLTGPAAPGYSKIGPAAKAYFDYINDKGGVNGRKIEFKYLDDAYNPSNTVQVVRQLVLQDKVFAIMGGLGTPTHTKVVDFLNQSKVPDLFVASGCLCWNQPDEQPYTFGWQPDYYIEGKLLGEYIRDNFPDKRIAYFTQGDDFGQDGIRGLDEFIPGDQVVTRQTYQPGTTDIAPQVTAIKEAKADVVVSFSIPAYTALLKLNTLKLGISPQIVVSNVGADAVTVSGLIENFAKQAGAEVPGMALMEGIITDAYLPTYLGASANNNSWVQLFRKIHAQKMKDVEFDGNVMYGMSQAYSFVEALQRAGQNPTRESVLEALKSGELRGPGLVPLSYSGDDHGGYAGGQIVQFTGGAPVPQGPPKLAGDGDAPATPHTATPMPAPVDGVPQQ